MGNSKYILVELPYRSISSRIINEITELNLNRGLTVVLAHIERYQKFDGYDALLKLISDGFALGQVNAYSFLHLRTRRKVLNLVKNGYVSFIASDCHSAEHNPPRINEAFAVILKKLGHSFVHKLRTMFDTAPNQYGLALKLIPDSYSTICYIENNETRTTTIVYIVEKTA